MYYQVFPANKFVTMQGRPVQNQYLLLNGIARLQTMPPVRKGVVITSKKMTDTVNSRQPISISFLSAGDAFGEYYSIKEQEFRRMFHDNATIQLKTYPLSVPLRFTLWRFQRLVFSPLSWTWKTSLLKSSNGSKHCLDSRICLGILLTALLESESLNVSPRNTVSSDLAIQKTATISISVYTRLLNV